MKFAYLIEPPFNFVDLSGKVTGCDVELARFVAQKLGMPAFFPIETQFANLLPGLNSGQWQMTTGMFATKERLNQALFSRPIWKLSDGLLIRRDNPVTISGYQSIADNSDLRLAVVRNQAQGDTAIQLGIGKERLLVFDTYLEAATAVRDQKADAYASVDRAHRGFINQNADWQVESIQVPIAEKRPASGAFALALHETQLHNEVDTLLAEFLGSQAHRRMVGKFGFTRDDVDLVCDLDD